MSFRSLSSRLSRKLSSLRTGNRISRVAGMPARSFYSVRDFTVGDSASAYGGVAVAAVAGVVGSFYFRKGVDQSAGEVTKEVVAREEDTKKVTKLVVAREEEAKEVTRQEAKKQLVRDETRKQEVIIEAETKEHNDNDFSLEEYLAEMTKMAAAQKKSRYERSCKMAIKEVSNVKKVTNREGIKDEAAMKARFEEWIKEYGKRYKNQEEKDRRYELFKAFANMVDKANAQGGAVFVTNHTADWTEEECQCLFDSDVDWDDYIDHIRSLIDKKNAKEKKASRA